MEKLGEATVDGNGRWTITTTNSEYTGSNVFFGFYSDNGYFKVTDRHGNPRRWLTSHYSGVLTDQNYGHHWGDGRNKIPGIGEVYYRGIDPKTLVTTVRFIERNSDFHRLARFLETRVDKDGWSLGARNER